MTKSVIDTRDDVQNARELLNAIDLLSYRAKLEDTLLETPVDLLLWEETLTDGSKVYSLELREKV